MDLNLILTLQLKLGFNFNYFPRQRGFKFIVTLNAFTDALCTEDGSMCRIKGPQKAARPAWNSQILDSFSHTGIHLCRVGTTSMVPNMNTRLHKLSRYATQDRGNGVRLPARQSNFFILKWAQQISGAQPASYIKGTGGTFLGETCLCIKVTPYLYLVQRLLTRGLTPPISRMHELMVLN